ncbi:MAG: hypothetical protein H6713_14685 [Myxococcales bacterium]|nr:hypothetical protein [Myxococcales bacterium]
MSSTAAARPLISDWLAARDGDAGLEALERAHALFFSKHAPEDTPGAAPLVLLCYHGVRSPRDLPMINECRGLIVRAGDWAPVCWGMPRFINDTHGDRAPEALAPPLRVEEKVDGTLIHLFRHAGRWRAATRHTFCARDRLYLELVLEASGRDSLDALAEAAALDPAVTWCLEICSARNRVIRRYDRPTLYLLAGYHTRARTPVEDETLDAIAARSGGALARPARWPGITGPEQARALLEQISRDDPLFEGLVIKDARGQRLKLKSERYLLIHRLKYRGWARLTPRLLAPMILRGEDRALLTALDGLRDDTGEFWRRRAVWAARVDAELAALGALWDQLPRDDRRAAAEIVLSDKTCSIGRLILRAQGVPPDAAGRRALLLEHSSRALAWMFPDGQLDDPCAGLDDAPPHAPRYCDPPDRALEPGVAATPPRRRAAGDWEVTCWCEAPMTLRRGKVDRLERRRCHCGGAFGLHTYAVGSLLWVCTRPGCPCTHEAHPRARRWPDEGVTYEAGQPLGLPASPRCKALRLQLHERMAALRRARGLDRTGVYQWLARTLDRPRARAHVALLDAPTCAAAIRAADEALAAS